MAKMEKLPSSAGIGKHDHTNSGRSPMLRDLPQTLSEAEAT